MAKIELTPAQRAVVENRGGSLLVSAAAGSGKTKVLVDRLFSYVMEEGCNLDDFLIITYTRAAAAELRGKIASELARRLAETVDDPHLQRQTLRVYQADIKTVDAFCSSLLRENVHLISDGGKHALSPDFRVLDEKEAVLLQKRVLQQVLEEFYEGISDDEEGHILADTLGAGRDDRVLEEQILQLYRKVQSHPYPEKWLSEQRKAWKNLGGGIDETPCAAAILSEIARRAAYWKRRLEETCLLMEENEALNVKYTPFFSVAAVGFAALADSCAQGWDEAAKAVQAVEFGKLKAVYAKDNAGELKEIAGVMWKAAKAELAKMAGYLSVSASEAMEDMRAIAAPMAALIELVMSFSNAYQTEKRRRNAADFSDQEHEAIRILVNPDGSRTELGALIAGRYKEIMVDEYQDTNEVQNFIFRAISRDGKNLFTVGDVKQSIYRFRLADPTIFIEKYRAFLPYAEAAEGEERKILLSQNFRSRKEILEATNFVFENVMSLSAGEMDYGQEEKLNFGAAYFIPKEGCETEYHILNLTKESMAGEDEEEAVSLAALEMRFLAKKVRALLEEGFPVRGEDGEERPIREEDIVILMRSPNTRKELLAKALWNEGITFSEGGSDDFFETAEIAVMFSFLKIIDNPRQDVPLISVLRSPLFGFTADRLAEIRAASPGTDFYTALAQDKKEDSREFLRELSELRDLAPEISVHNLLWHIYDRFHVLGIFGAMGGGNVRKDNLTALFEHVKKLENAGYSGLFQLVTQLEQMIQNGETPDTSIRAASGGVRLMSIHKSKGLEFPVVILADLSKGFNDKDLLTPVLVHPKLGVGAERVDLARKIRYPTVARFAIEQRLKSESHAEEMRILYVAMTRAKEKLIMVDSRRNAANVIKKLIPSASCPAVPEAVCDGKCMGDWILLPLLCRWEAKPLRDLAGMETLMHYSGDDTPWKVFIHDAGEYRKISRKVRPLQERDGAALPDFAAMDHIYPYQRETALPAKVAATQLKGREVDEEIAENTVKTPRNIFFSQPKFMAADRSLTAAEKGTALHLVMQYIDFSAARSEAEVKEEVLRLQEKRLLRAEEAKAVDTSAVSAFLVSSLADRIRNAEHVLREYRFVILVDANQYDPQVASCDKMMLQGVVDCCIEEAGELTVIDFKTDRVDEDSLMLRAEEYRPQLEAYSAALERIFEKPVREKILYFFAAKKAVKL